MNGVTLIEPKITSDLCFDNDTLTKSLEFVRTLLPRLLTDRFKNYDIQVVPVYSPHGPPYPAYGVTLIDSDTLSDAEEMQRQIDNAFSSLSTSDLLEAIKTINYLNWETLQNKSRLK